MGVDNEVTGAQVWRSSDGTAWSRVGTGGLGGSDNVYFWDFAEAESQLYASVSNSSVVRSGGGRGVEN